MTLEVSRAQPQQDATPSAQSEPSPCPKRKAPIVVPAVPEPPARRHSKMIDAVARGDVHRTVESIPPPVKLTRQPTRFDPAMDAIEEVTVYIAKHASNVMDMLEAWDTNRDRMISKPEFRNFLVANGFILSRVDTDELFGSFDEDGSGQLDYVELVRGARKAAFARGKIPKPIPKPGNSSVTRYNEMWSKRNQAHAEAYKQQVKESDAAAAAQKEELLQSRRARLLHKSKERQETVRRQGTVLRQPFCLRQQQEGRWTERTDRMWDEAVSKEVLFLPPILTARLASSEPAESPRRVLAEQRTSRHTREGPQSRREALRQVHELPQRLKDARTAEKAAARARFRPEGSSSRRASPVDEEWLGDSDADDL